MSNKKDQLHYFALMLSANLGSHTGVAVRVYRWSDLTDFAMRMRGIGLFTSGVLKLPVGLFSVACVMFGVFKQI